MKNFSADTQQERHCIENLPGDVQKEILHRLPFDGIDLSSFKEACLVSHAWQSLIQNLSRDLLRKYFPYLAVTQPQHFTDVPLRLLAEECQRYQKWFPSIDMALLLAALSGEREIIAAAGNINLYVLFLANGHSISLAEFTDEDSLLIRSNALGCAAHSGHIEAIKILLKKEGEQIPFPSRMEAFIDAAARGHIEIANILLEETKAQFFVSGGYVFFEALVHAAQDGHTEMVNTILEKEKEGAQISDFAKGKALVYAAKNGHAETVKLLLKKAGAQISIEKKDLAMKHAERYNHLEIIYLILCHQAKEALIKGFKNDETKNNLSQKQKIRSFHTIPYRPSITIGVGCALMGFFVLGLPLVACLFILASMTLGIEIIKKLARNAGERALQNEKHLEDAKLKPFIQKGKISELSWKNYCLDTFAMPSSMFPAFLSRKSEGYQMGRAMARKEKAHYEMKAQKHHNRSR